MTVQGQYSFADRGQRLGAGRGGSGGHAAVPWSGLDAAWPPRPVLLLETVTAGDVLGGYLRAQAGELLRSLRVHGESVGSAESAGEAAGAVRRLRRVARRISGALYIYRPLFDTVWADQLRAELGWLSGTLAREYGYAARLDRLLGSLHRLASDGGTTLPAGAARAGALLERQLTLSRTRAHSAALQALRSSRFHAVVDSVAVLASEVPLAEDPAGRPAARVLVPQAESARRRVTEAVGALPLSRAEAPYNAEALDRSLSAEAQQDASWHQARALLRLHRYAEEALRHSVLAGDEPARGEGARDAGPRDGGSRDGGSRDARERDAVGESGEGTVRDSDVFLLGPGAAGVALNRHREAAEAAAAASAAARTPRIAPATAYALGVLHAGQRHEVEAARFDFGRHWKLGGGTSERQP